MSDTLSLAQARRIAVASQGLQKYEADAAAAIRQMALLQLDFVNILIPSHYLVLYTRLGSYDTADLDKLVYGVNPTFTEHWAHEASIVPHDLWPHLRYRRDNHRAWHSGFEGHITRRYLEKVRAEVAERGPLRANQVAKPTRAPARIAESWYGTAQRVAMEALFGKGVLSIHGRDDDFGRIYDLSERVIPAEHHGVQIPAAEQQRELLRRASRALGVATLHDLADYFRMKIEMAKPRVLELAAAGDLLPVRVEGWKEPAYLHPRAAALAETRCERTALLSPFDPLIWFRKRTQRLFGFEYKLEIFTPAAKRRWGCFVLPLLIGDRLVARADLKAERKNGVLHVLASYVEDGASRDAIREHLPRELQALAQWLQLKEATLLLPRSRHDACVRGTLASSRASRAAGRARS